MSNLEQEDKEVVDKKNNEKAVVEHSSLSSLENSFLSERLICTQARSLVFF